MTLLSHRFLQIRILLYWSALIKDRQERENIYGCKPEVSQTLVGTSALVQPEYKLEIKVMAYID